MRTENYGGPSMTKEQMAARIKFLSQKLERAIMKRTVMPLTPIKAELDALSAMYRKQFGNSLSFQNGRAKAEAELAPKLARVVNAIPGAPTSVKMSDGSYSSVKYNVMEQDGAVIAILVGTPYRGMGKTKQEAWRNLAGKIGPGLDVRFML